MFGKLKRNLHKTCICQKVLFFISKKQYNKNKIYFIDGSKAKDLQLKNLVKILQYSRQHCMYFKKNITEDVSESNCIQILKTIPILTKSIIRENANEIYSDEINILTCKTANTGGSTGEPLVFPIMTKSCSYENICQYDLLTKMGWIENEPIAAFSGYTPIKENLDNCNFYTIRPNFPYGKYNFSSYYVSLENTPKYVEDLNRLRPLIIRSYPSSLADLAKYMKMLSLTLSYNLKGIYVTSEQLLEDDAAIMKEVFHCPIWGQYGHSELSVFAVQPDGDKNYYVSPLYGYTEIIDIETGKHVDEGGVGEIVVTGFSNYALPFIRYATGDLAQYLGVNEKGEVILSQLQGRSVDYLISDNGNRIFLTGLIFGNHLRAFKNIFAWQLEQEVPGVVKMRIKKDTYFTNIDENDIRVLFEASNIKVIFDYESEIVKSKRGKRIFLIQHCNEQ